MSDLCDVPGCQRPATGRADGNPVKARIQDDSEAMRAIVTLRERGYSIDAIREAWESTKSADRQSGQAGYRVEGE